MKNVGVAGFEPATSSSQTTRDNRTTLYPDKPKRRERDSNPRYRYQYNTLAGCRFQPLSNLFEKKDFKYIHILLENEIN